MKLLHIAHVAIVMLSSRTKCLFTSWANEAFVLLDEENNDEDIFEDAQAQLKMKVVIRHKRIICWRLINL